MNRSDVVKSILSELAYFDIFEHPLTLIELWRFLQVPGVKLSQIKELLETDSVLVANVVNDRGFYRLKGEKPIIDTRLRRYREAEAKFKKALRFTRRLARFPFIRMIAICNSLAYSNSRSLADIDLFIITEPGHIWTARMYVTGYLKLLGERPEKDQTKDKLCASFFLSKQNLDLSSIRLNQPDIYLAHWMLQVYPLYDPENIYQDFMKTNSWVRDIYPNAYPMDVAPARRVKVGTGLRQASEAIHSGWLGGTLEKQYEKIQRRLLPKSLSDLLGQDTRVVMSDEMLKFHDNDRRGEYQGKWHERLKELGI